LALEAREIKTRIPGAAIVILSSHADTIFVEHAKGIGAASVEKSQAGKALLRTIDAALKGEQPFVLA
jgi:DNA-binding NarL/FixJ family response regulator